MAKKSFEDGLSHQDRHLFKFGPPGLMYARDYYDRRRILGMQYEYNQMVKAAEAFYEAEREEERRREQDQEDFLRRQEEEDEKRNRDFLMSKPNYPPYPKDDDNYGDFDDKPKSNYLPPIKPLYSKDDFDDY